VGLSRSLSGRFAIKFQLCYSAGPQLVAGSEPLFLLQLIPWFLISVGFHMSWHTIPAFPIHVLLNSLESNSHLYCLLQTVKCLFFIGKSKMFGEFAIPHG
jgi:hypothetical protein